MAVAFFSFMRVWLTRVTSLGHTRLDYRESVREIEVRKRRRDLMNDNRTLSYRTETFFTILNAVALSGWSIVLLIIILTTTTSTNNCSNGHDDDLVVDSDNYKVCASSGQRIPIIDLLYILELICIIEVCRIAVGQLKGNLLLGLVLHAIRMTCLMYVLPDGILLLPCDVTTMTVLYAWSITEVTRYPMYLNPTSDIVRRVRLVVPLGTFPVGCMAEAYGSYRTLLKDWKHREEVSEITNLIKIGMLGMVVLINGLLGPTMAYPALIKKGVPALMGTREERKTKQE